MMGNSWSLTLMTYLFTHQAWALSQVKFMGYVMSPNGDSMDEKVSAGLVPLQSRNFKDSSDLPIPTSASSGVSVHWQPLYQPCWRWPQRNWIGTLQQRKLAISLRYTIDLAQRKSEEILCLDVTHQNLLHPIQHLWQKWGYFQESYGIKLWNFAHWLGLLPWFNWATYPPIKNSSATNGPNLKVHSHM